MIGVTTSSWRLSNQFDIMYPKVVVGLCWREYIVADGRGKGGYNRGSPHETPSRKQTTAVTSICKACKIDKLRLIYSYIMTDLPLPTRLHTQFAKLTFGTDHLARRLDSHQRNGTKHLHNPLLVFIFKFRLLSTPFLTVGHLPAWPPSNVSLSSY